MTQPSLPKKQQLLPKFVLQASSDKTAWEKAVRAMGYKLVAGTDEAGRGAWAGPVVAAAVIFDESINIPEIDDSKKLTPQERDSLFDLIKAQAVSFGVGIVSNNIIDEINILQASLMAMHQAIMQLKPQPDFVIVDGNAAIKMAIPQRPLIKGDSLSVSVGAASILAKVTRDRLMCDLEKTHPQFQFSRHKGYGTKLHQDEIKKFGPLPIHRHSFKPLKLLRQNIEGKNHPSL